MASIVTVSCLWLSIFAANKGGIGFKDPDARVGYLGFATIFLVWSCGFRVACAFTYYPYLAYNETLFYTLSVLPEMINILLWLAPDRFMIRSALGSGFESWWVKNHNQASGIEESAKHLGPSEQEYDDKKKMDGKELL